MFCSHGKRKHMCKACGGSALCGHGRIKRQCRECHDGGSYFCRHGRQTCADLIIALDLLALALERLNPPIRTP